MLYLLGVSKFTWMVLLISGPLFGGFLPRIIKPTKDNYSLLLTPRKILFSKYTRYAMYLYAWVLCIYGMTTNNEIVKGVSIAMFVFSIGILVVDRIIVRNYFSACSLQTGGIYGQTRLKDVSSQTWVTDDFCKKMKS